MSLELYIQDIIKGKRRGIFPSLIKFPLKILSYLYRLGVSCRNWAYDTGWLKQYSAPLPLVVSIGNITVGGTGKTPFTILFAKIFENEVKVAVASRGYRSKAEHLKTPLVVSRGGGPLHPAEVCGDEPYLLAENLKPVHVYAGKNRILSSNMAAQDGVQMMILEDGMQHRQLARDLDIVLLDGKDPFGKGAFLPYGLLRDDPRSLSRADLIVLRGATHFLEIKEQVAHYTQAPVIGVRMVVESPQDLSGKKVGVFCGIANPEQFLDTVKGLGAEVVAEKFFPDHTLGDLDAFAQKCRSLGAAMLLCTEKDRVKLSSLSDIILPICWIKSRLEIVEGTAEWTNFIENIKKKLDTRSIR